MNGTFVLMGFSSILTGWNSYQGFFLPKIALLTFGISLILTAIFSHAPIDSTIDFNKEDDQLHSLFATITGFSFTVLAISTGFIKEERSEMYLPFVIALSATILSLLIFKITNLAGIWQRLLFLTCFGWMIFEYSDHCP